MERFARLLEIKIQRRTFNTLKRIKRKIGQQSWIAIRKSTLRPSKVQTKKLLKRKTAIKGKETIARTRKRIIQRIYPKRTIRIRAKTTRIFTARTNIQTGFTKARPSIQCNTFSRRQTKITIRIRKLSRIPVTINSNTIVSLTIKLWWIIKPKRNDEIMQKFLRHRQMR